VNKITKTTATSNTTVNNRNEDDSRKKEEEDEIEMNELNNNEHKHKHEQGHVVDDVADADVVLGMVELSLQHPDADRNPLSLPLPQWVKSELARHTLRGELQGWTTNLFIDPARRGFGYSKLLMSCTEGMIAPYNNNNNNNNNNCNNNSNWKTCPLFIYMRMLI